MHIFIDESGTFMKGSDWGVVCSLALPTKALGPARRELAFRAKAWVRAGGELKGSDIAPDQLMDLIDVLQRHDALLHATAIHVAGEDFAAVARHQRAQGEGITCHLTAAHQPTLVNEVWALRAQLERMPPQLYLQCLAQRELLVTAGEEIAMYFAQRRPRELGAFTWLIDAKDPRLITSQEAWWRDTLAPLLETRSRREPFRRVHGAKLDYRYFDRAYTFEKELQHPDYPPEQATGVNIVKFYTAAIGFRDSRSDILLQAVDILANYMRRLLSGRVTDDAVARALGRLQLARREAGTRGMIQSVRIVSLSDRTGAELPERLRLKHVLNLMASTRRDMFLQGPKVGRNRKRRSPKVAATTGKITL